MAVHGSKREHSRKNSPVLYWISHQKMAAAAHKRGPFHKSQRKFSMGNSIWLWPDQVRFQLTIQVKYITSRFICMWISIIINRNVRGDIEETEILSQNGVIITKIGVLVCPV